MSEVETLTYELLQELEGLSPEEIEQIRTEWLAELRNRGAFERMGNFVNAMMDCALQRAQKAEVA